MKKLEATERQFDPKDLMSVQVVAQRLEVSERTIYKYIKEKKLVAVMIGRLWRIPTAAYLTFVYGKAVDHVAGLEEKIKDWEEKRKRLGF